MTDKSRREKVKDELREVSAKLKKIREEGHAKIPEIIDEVIEQEGGRKSTIGYLLNRGISRP